MKNIIQITLVAILYPMIIQAQGVAIDFSQYDGSQITNSDFEDWSGPNFDNVPVGWHSFESVGGSSPYAASAYSTEQTSKSTSDLHEGTTGDFCLRLVPRHIGQTLANGTITTGRIHVGDISPTNPMNHVEMDMSSTDTSNGTPFHALLNKRPTAIGVWVKFTQETPQAQHPFAAISATITNGKYYQEPTIDNDSSMVVGHAQNNKISTNDGRWQHLYVPFRYESESYSLFDEPEAIMVTLSTNADPGQGSPGDELLVDDLELIYTQHVTIPSSGYATLTNVAMKNHKARIPEGITAYTLDSNSLSEPRVKDIYKAGQVLPFNGAVLLKGQPGEYDFCTTLYEKSETISIEGDINMVGAAELNYPTKEYRFYRLTERDGVALFYEVFHGLKIRDIEALIRVKADKASKSYDHILIRPEIEGDMNNDGIASISDVTEIVSRILGMQKPNDDLFITDADVNGDNYTSIADVMKLVDIILGN